MNNQPHLEEAKKTLNQKGYMHPPTWMADRFIEFASSAKGPVVDMGAGFGHISRLALNAGAKVIACDASVEHLTHIRDELAPAYHTQLSTHAGWFPNDFDFPANSISGILFSFVFPFLSPDELMKGLKKSFGWLEQGGKIFVVTYTPFITPLVSFMPEYAKRIEQGSRWPGYIENMHDYVQLPEVQKMIPQKVHHIDLPEMKRAINEVGFQIEYGDYLATKDDPVFDALALDGRERIGIIAIK